MLGVAERTWRRKQAQAKEQADCQKGPWPKPARNKITDSAVTHALAHPAWGHRKVWAVTRYNGHEASQASVLRLLRDKGLLRGASYQRERRQLAERRKAAFADEPTGPN